MSTFDYTDRKIDIMITSGFSGKLELEFSNKIVSGIQKAVQSFLLELFTIINSNIFNRQGGTVFAQQLYNDSGTVQTGLIINYLALSLSTVVDKMKKNPSDQADENIISATIQDVTEDKGTVSADILVSTEAGQSYNFVIPVDFQTFLG